MNILKSFLNKLRKSELAQGLVEYAIILALISAVTVGALGGVGEEVNKTLDKSANPEVTVKVEKGYIPIASAEDMNNIRNGETQVFGKGSSWEGTYTSGLDKKYIQVADVDLSKLDWDPIDEFTGTYEGSGLSIRNLKVDNEGSSGLFGKVQGAKLQDINLEDVSVQGTDSTGGLVGNATQASTLDRVSVTGLVKHKGENKSLGGIVGELNDKSRLTNSYVDVKIDGNDNVGALVGHLKSSTIYQSYAHGTLDGKDSIGGLVGVAESNSQINQAYANVRLKGTDTAVGGLVGKDEGANVKQSHWDVETSGLKETANGKGEGNTSYEMTLARTYKDWDFEKVWKIKDGETYPTFDGENTRLEEIVVTFIGNDDKKYPVTGLFGSTLKDYHEGEIPEPTKEGHTLEDWKDEDDKDFDMETKLGIKDFEVTPNWKLNEAVTKTFYPSEEGSATQNKSVNIEDMHDLVSYDVDKGKIDLKNRDGGNLEFNLSGRPYDRRVQTGGEEILADSKEVSAQNSSSYDSDGYKGTLEKYVYSGSYTPADTKSVTNQSSSNYNSDGYTGTLSQYHHSGGFTAGASKYVSGQNSSWYNSGGYSGYLDSYQESYWVSGDTKWVSGQTSSYYNSGGYSGTLSSYVYSGSYQSADSKNVSVEECWGYTSFDTKGYYGKVITKAKAISDAKAHNASYMGRTMYYNSGGYTGTLKVTRTRTYDNSYPGDTMGDISGYYTYTGTVSRPASDTRVYRYQGNVSSSGYNSYYTQYRGYVYQPDIDNRVYRYQGNVTKPATDDRVYRYRGTVNRPYSDTRIWDNYYKYGIIVSYIPK